MQAALVRPLRLKPREAETVLTSSDRRTLGGVLGFLAGLAALGPIAALAAAVLGAAAASLADSR